MRVRNSALPLSRVEIDTKGGKTVVTLWDGNYTEEEASDGGEGGAQPVFNYEIYQIETPFRSTLKEDIEASFEAWWKAGADRERAARIAEEERRETEEITASLIETLLDYDFRLMMLEEGA